MVTFFGDLLLIFYFVFCLNQSAEATGKSCYITSSEVTTAALIRNKWKKSSEICERFTPGNKIQSKGECRNSYCPVVLEGNSKCGKRGWIFQNLIKEVSCASEPEIDISGTANSVEPEAVSSNQTADIACIESKANYLNVRYKGNLRGEPCGKMMRGDKLASKGDCKEGWCPVDIKNCGGRGWIAQRFLEEKICKKSEVSTDFGLSAGVYWEDEKISGIKMKPGYMGQNTSGSLCTARGIKQSRCQRLIKMNAHAALGMCLPDGDARNLEQLMKKHKISAYTGIIPVNKRAVRKREMSKINLKSHKNKALRKALSKTLLALEKIGKGIPHLSRSKGVKIIFDNGRSAGGLSRRNGNQIQLRRGNQNRQGCAGHSKHGGTDNIALIVHELAHFVGNPKGYSGLMKATGGKYCMVSNYSDGGQNMTRDEKKAEHFAEAFAAYVLMPERFKGKGKTCNKAFNYMKSLFGEPNMTKSCIARKRSYKIRGAGSFDEGNNPQNSGGSVTWLFEDKPENKQWCKLRNFERRLQRRISLEL